MKTIKYFFFVALGSVLMAADCSNKDSEFYNDVYLSAPDLIQIEAQQTYHVGDILYLNSNNFSRYLNEPGQSNKLDVYKTTGGANSFNFTYLLEKKIGDTDDDWALVVLGPNLIKEKGAADETDLYVAALCVYKANANPALDSYEFRNGLKLTQPGQYRLSFGYNSASATSVELRSDSFNNNLFLNIDSVMTNGLDSAGNYNFTVLE